MFTKFGYLFKLGVCRVKHCHYIIPTDGMCVVCAGLNSDCDPFSKGRRSGESLRVAYQTAGSRWDYWNIPVSYSNLLLRYI